MEDELPLYMLYLYQSCPFAPADGTIKYRNTVYFTWQFQTPPCPPGVVSNVILPHIDIDLVSLHWAVSVLCADIRAETGERGVSLLLHRFYNFHFFKKGYVN